MMGSLMVATHVAAAAAGREKSGVAGQQTFFVSSAEFVLFDQQSSLEQRHVS
jgi:hypothetical protein